MLQRALIAGALIGGTVLGYRYWKRQQGATDRTRAGRATAMRMPSPLQRATAERPAITGKRMAPPVPKRATPFRPAPRPRKPSPFVPKKATLIRPGTLSECCETLCLPTLDRETRSYPVLSKAVSENRNLWEDYCMQDCNNCNGC